MTDTAWTTADECAWLDRIGQTYCHTQGMPAAPLLRHYLAGAARRQRWDNLDPEKIIDHAQRRLLQAELEEACP